MRLMASGRTAMGTDMGSGMGMGTGTQASQLQGLEEGIRLLPATAAMAQASAALVQALARLAPLLASSGTGIMVSALRLAALLALLVLPSAFSLRLASSLVSVHRTATATATGFRRALGIRMGPVGTAQAKCQGRRLAALGLELVLPVDRTLGQAHHMPATAAMGQRAEQAGLQLHQLQRRRMDRPHRVLPQLHPRAISMQSCSTQIGGRGGTLASKVALPPRLLDRRTVRTRGLALTSLRRTRVQVRAGPMRAQQLMVQAMLTAPVVDRLT